MFPIFVLFGKEISMYAVMCVVGIFVAGWLFCRRIKKIEHDDTEAILFLIVLSIGILIGAHILYAMTNLDCLKSLSSTFSLTDWLTVLSDLFGGMVFYGGLIGAYILGFTYGKIRKLNLELYMDTAALFAPAFHGFARIGCFLGGCCYGIESNFGFAASGNTITDIGEVCRFPVQLLESALNFLIALLIFVLLKKGVLKGKMFYLYLALYAFIRFFDEFLRGDEIRGFVFGLSTSQFISVFVEIFASLMISIHLIKEHRKKA